jgi:DNA-binding response OmpR family regulator
MSEPPQNHGRLKPSDIAEIEKALWFLHPAIIVAALFELVAWLRRNHHRIGEVARQTGVSYATALAAVLDTHEPNLLILRDGPLELNRAAGTVTIEGAPVNLSPSEFGILAELLAHPGETQSREAIMTRLGWLRPGGTAGRQIDAHIPRLRRKLGPYGTHVVSDNGYRWDPIEPIEL